MYFIIDDTQYSRDLIISDENKQSKMERDFYCFGGFFFPQDIMQKLLEEIWKLKFSCFNRKNIPIKNNFKDLKQIYTEKQYKIVRENIENFRISLLEVLGSYEVKTLISIVNVFIDQRESYSFPLINILQRFGLEVKENEANINHVVLDWDQKENIKEYQQNYQSLYYFGEDCKGNKCFSGPLNNLKFYPAITFSSTVEDELLQVADIIVGSWRYLITQFWKEGKTLKKEKDKITLELLIKLVRRFEGDIFKGGLIIEEKNFKEFIQKHCKE